MTVFQELGAYVYTGSNLGVDKLDRFAEIGGKNIALVIYNDDVVGDKNKKLLPGLRAQAAVRHIKTWGWYNGKGDDPKQDAKNIVGIHSNFGLFGIMLDLEASYQYPEGNADLMPQLVAEIVDLSARWITKPPIIVSTNGMNSSMIWNGRIFSPPRSMAALGVRVSPQWYSCYYLNDLNQAPQAQMQWLLKNGNKDYNFADQTQKKTSPPGQGLPRSYVKPSIEGTGMESDRYPGGCDVRQELADCVEAKKYGLTEGLWYYTLEAGPMSDLDEIEKQRGVLYLG